MNEKSDFDRYVEANFHWNFAANLLDITFITIGHHLISRETIVPLLVSQLTSSKLAACPRLKQCQSSTEFSPQNRLLSTIGLDLLPIVASCGFPSRSRDSEALFMPTPHSRALGPQRGLPNDPSDVATDG